MYVETPLHDQDQAALLESSSPYRRSLAPGLCALGLVTVGLVGRSLWSSGANSFASGESVGLDLVDTEVEIQMDMSGISYWQMTQHGGALTFDWGGAGPPAVPAAPEKAKCDLVGAVYGAGAPFTMTTTREDAFKLAVRQVVAKKLKIKWGAISSAVDIKQTPLSGAGDSPLRTEFPVTVTVPSELEASAVMSRLNEGGTLLKELKDTLIACNLADGAVLIHSIMKSKHGDSVVMETKSKPDIVLELDIKGLFYKQLSLDETMRTAFVNAVRSGIVPEGYSLDAKSIALDITDAGANAQNEPFVHVVASFPVPAQLPADATMSQWPGGRAKIGTAVTSNLKKIADISRASRDVDSAVVHKIVVFPGALHLGGIRSAYETQVAFEMGLHRLLHVQANAAHPKFSVIRDKVKEFVKAQVGKDDVDVVFLKNDATRSTEVREPGVATDPSIADIEGYDPILLRVTVSHGDGATVNLKDAAAWETKLIPAVRSAETFFKKSYPTAAVAADYAFSMRVPKLKNVVSTIDLDMVVSGVDYPSLRSETKGAFLADLAKAVRSGLDWNPAAPIADMDKIKVLVSSHGDTGALNVRAKVPAPHQDVALKALETRLEQDVQNGNLKRELETTIQAIDGMNYVSTWTAAAVTVSLPGHINDFSGDVVGDADAL